LLRRPFGLHNARERRVVPQVRRRIVQREAWIMWAVYLGILVISLALHSWAAVTYWLLPRVVGEPVMRLIRMSEHVGRPRVPDMLRNTRTVVSLAPVRWLAWNMAYHAEHHALPSVPFHALPAVHRLIGGRFEEVQPGYLATQRQLIRNARRHQPA
jgi:fatty acid desaturase